MKFIGLKIFADFYAFFFSDNRVKLIFIKKLGELSFKVMGWRGFSVFKTDVGF